MRPSWLLRFLQGAAGRAAATAARGCSAEPLQGDPNGWAKGTIDQLAGSAALGAHAVWQTTSDQPADTCSTRKRVHSAPVQAI